MDLYDTGQGCHCRYLRDSPDRALDGVLAPPTRTARGAPGSCAMEASAPAIPSAIAGGRAGLESAGSGDAAAVGIVDNANAMLGAT